VLGPEAFDPVPFMEKMAEYGFPYSIKEIAGENFHKSVAVAGSDEAES